MVSILAIIGPILGAVIKLGDYVVNPIKKQVSYLCCYNSNAQTLIQEAEKLDIARQTVQQQVDAAQRNLEDIRPDVADWLKRANETKTTSREVLTDAENYIQKGCLSKWCPFIHYCSSREAKKRTDAFVGLQDNARFDRVSVPANPANLPPIPATSAIRFKSRERIEKEIMDALKDDSVYLIGLCGMGGVGKTTMVEKIRYEAKIMMPSMFEVVVRAVVSQRPDLKKVQQEIAEQIGLKLEEQSEQIRAAKLHERLKSLKSFLIILDDVWEKLDLTKDLGIPSQSTTEKRKLILTSRVLDVLILTKDPKILTMDVLPEDEAWSLFQEKTGELIDAVHETAKEVAKECKGLPLALVVVGSALRGKNEHSWKDALRQLKRCIAPANFPEMLQEVYAPLMWSYDQLQNEEARNIFRLCCLFPEHYPIDVETLVRYGWGLHIFRGIENLSEARNRVYALLERLKLSFLLIHDGDERVKMHDVIRDMGISIASKDGQVFMVNDKRKEWQSKEFDADYTHISIRLAGNFPPECIDCPRLEFLRMELDWRRIVEMPENLFDSMRGLRVLVANNFQFESLPSSTFGLTNLRALHLENCWLVIITSLVGKLENLEILNLRYSYFKELPKEVGQLKKLKLLDLTGCWSLREIAAGVVSELVNLEELLMFNSFSEWEAEEDGIERKKASLAEVASLRKLVNLEIDIKNPKLLSLDAQWLERYYLRMGDTASSYRPKFERKYKPKYKKVAVLIINSESCLGKFCPSVSRNAEYLKLKGAGCIEIINDLVAPYREVLNTNLKSLKLWNINNITGIFGCQILKGNFSKLKVLKVRYCDNLRNILAPPMFRGLTSLTKLKLFECGKLEEVIAQEEARERPKNEEEITFPHLKELELSYLPKMRRFCHMTGTLKLPSLEGMIIRNCPMLESFAMGSNDSNTKFLFNKEVLCTNLKSLELKTINSAGIFSCGTLKGNFNALEVLEVKSCDNLRNILAPPLFRGLTSLTKLKLSGCRELEEVIAQEEAQEKPKNEAETLFPHLKELELSSLPKLRRFCHMTDALKLPSLEEMIIRDCPMLESFSIGSNDSDTKFLFNKKVLCTNLKSLKLKTINSAGIFSCGTLKGNFNKLEVLEVKSCVNLRSILVPPMLRGLTSLTKLKLSECWELEEVIAQEEAQERPKNEEETLFPHLKELELSYLPNMRRFCHMTDALKFPSLEEMIIRCCPMLESFSVRSDNSDIKFLFNKEEYSAVKPYKKISIN